MRKCKDIDRFLEHWPGVLDSMDQKCRNVEKETDKTKKSDNIGGAERSGRVERCGGGERSGEEKSGVGERSGRGDRSGRSGRDKEADEQEEYEGSYRVMEKTKLNKNPRNNPQLADAVDSDEDLRCNNSTKLSLNSVN